MKHLDQLKTLTQKEKNLLIRCKDAIHKVDSTARVILYGSRARNQEQPESDYDLLVLINGSANLEREDMFRRQLFNIEIETGYVFTVIVYSWQDWDTSVYRAMPFYQNIEKDGVIL